jgi:curved DNA-binding protein CbpA
MARSPDYYSVLGLPPSADHVAIHAAWKALLRRYHPDVNQGVDVSARAKAINEAYAVLGKKDARAAYDRSRLPPPSSRPHAARHSTTAEPDGSRPVRPGLSARPSGSFSQERDANPWVTGIVALLLAAAPVGMILVLHYEESGSSHADRRVATVHHLPDKPADTNRSSSDTTLRPEQPAP